MSSNSGKKKTLFEKSSVVHDVLISFQSVFVFFKVSLLREHFVKNLKVIYGNNLHKNIVF